MQAAASRHRVEYFDVSFGPGPLLMRVEASACFRHLEVAGFGVDEEGNPGPAERSGRVHTGDVVLGVNGQLFRGATFDEAMGRIAAATRPITLHFAREHGLPRGWEVGGSYGQGGTYYLHAPTGQCVAFRPREVAPTLRPPPGEADEVQAHARAQALPSGTMNPLAMGATAAAGAGSLPDPPAAARPFFALDPEALSMRGTLRKKSHARRAGVRPRAPGPPPKRLTSRGLTRRQAHQWQARFFELDVRRRELRYARQAPSAEDEAALHAASAATRIRARARAGGGAPCVALPLSWVSHVDYHPGKRQGRRLAVAVSVPPGVQSVAGARGGPSAGAARVGLLRAIQRRRRPSGDAGDIPVTAAASGPPEDELLSALARSAPTEEARGRAEAAVAARSRQGSRRNTEASLDSVELSAAASAAAGGDDTASVGTHSPAASEASFATGIGGGGPTASQEAAVARLWTGRPDVRLYAASSLDLMAGSKEIAAAWVDALAGVCMGQQLAAEVLQRVVRRHLRASRRRRQSRPRSVLTPLLPVAARPRPQRSSVAAAAGAISGAAAAASAQARAARRASLATLAARGTPRPAAAQSDRGEGAAREGGEHLRSRQPAHVLRFARRASTAAGRIVPGQVEPYSERVASTARIAAARRASAAKTEAPPGTAAPEQLEPNRGALVACHVEQRKRGSEALGAAQLAWLDLRRNDSDTAWFLAPLPFGAGPSGAAEAPRSVQVESGAGRPADVASRLRDDTCAFGALRLVVGGQFQLVFFTWAAPRVQPVERGRARVLAHAFRQGTEGWAVDVDVRTPRDLDEAHLRARVVSRKATTL